MNIAKILFGIALAISVSGCMNIYVRSPGNPYIERTYQSTSDMSALTLVAAFPQMMSPQGGPAFMWENCLSIPFLGLPCAIDTVLEAVVDTVCFPYDCVASKGKKNREIEE